MASSTPRSSRGGRTTRQGEKKGKEKEFFKAYKPLPSTHVDTLSFDKLVPPEKLAGAEFTGEGMEDEDDE
jgi:hypothetical protein